MSTPELKIKLDHITGLRQIALDELSEKKLAVLHENGEIDSVYIKYTEDLDSIKSLRSVLRAYVISQNEKYTPRFIANHKSILRDLISIVVEKK